MKIVHLAAAALIVAAAVPSAVLAEGNLAAAPAERIELALTGPAATLSTDTFELVTGKYYRLTVTSDGGAEALFSAKELFDNAWMNQVVVSGVEIKLWGDTIKAVEVGEQGAAEVQITFVPVRPGAYHFTVKAGPEDRTGTFNVK